MTMIAFDKDVDNLIIAVAQKFRIDANLIRAISWQESEGDFWRPRFEPQMSDTLLFEADTFAHNRRISLITEQTLQKMSWGPMQVMGATARWLGFALDLPQLCQPELGLFYGAKYLRWLLDRLPDEDNVVAAYNAGHGVKKTLGGMWPNQKQYVDPVYSILRELRKLN